MTSLPGGNRKEEMDGKQGKLSVEARHWPQGLPLLHPQSVQAILLEKVKKSANSGWINTYAESFSGAQVIEVLFREPGLEMVQEKPNEVLEFLEFAKVIQIVGHSSKIKLKLNQKRTECLYKMTDREVVQFSHGVLFVKVHSAEGLIAENMSGTSNPFATVQVGDETISTKVVSRELNPKWNETFVFFINSEDSHESPPRHSAMDLTVTLSVFGHRKTKAKASLGTTGRIMVKPPHTAKKTVKSMESIPLASVPLRRENIKDSQPVLLIIRTAFNKGGAKSRKAPEESLSMKAASGTTSDELASFELDASSDSDDEENLNSSGVRIHLPDSGDKSKGDSQQHHGRQIQKMGQINCSVMWMQIVSDQTKMEEEKFAALVAGLNSSSSLESFEGTGESKAKISQTKSSPAVSELGQVNDALPTVSTVDVKRPISSRPSTKTGSLLYRRNTQKNLESELARTHNQSSSASEDMSVGDEDGGDPKKKRPGRMNRMISATKKFTKWGQTTSSSPSEEDLSEVSNMGISRLVMYETLRKKVKAIVSERVRSIEDELLKYSTSKEAPPSTSLSITDAGDEDEDSVDLASIKCFLFDYPEKAFDFMADPAKKHILRPMWVAIAPLFPPLCHFTNAHHVFDGLLLAQNGERAARSAAMSGQVLPLKFPSFLAYVRALRAERMSLEKLKRKVISDFPSLGNSLKDGEETVLRVIDKVRGGRSDAAFMRKSQSGGKLVITSKAAYYAKKRVFHQNQVQREDLFHAVQVLESNGSVDYGLMIGFSNKCPNPSSLGTNSEESDSEMMTPQALEQDARAAKTKQRRSDLEDGLDGLEFLDAAHPSEEGILQEDEAKVLSSLLREESLDDEFFETGGGDGYQTPTSNPRTSTLSGGEGESPKRRSVSVEPRRIQTNKFTFSLPQLIVARYAVYRFPSSNSWRKRDADILILREIIAFRIFCDLVLRKVIEEQIASVSSNSEAERARFLEMAVKCSRNILVQEISSFKGILRVSKVETGSNWDWLNGVDTFETFGDRWTWRKWTPLALLSYVSGALQPTHERSEKIQKMCVSCLYHLALDMIQETADVLGVEVTWVPGFGKNLRSVALQTRIRHSGAFNSPYLKGELFQANTDLFLHAQDRSKSLSNRNLATKEDLSDNREPEGLIASIDNWWLEYMGLMQTDIVRSAAKLKSMGQNFELLKSILAPVELAMHETVHIFKSILTWESPAITVGLGFTSLALIVTGYTTYFLGLLLGSIALYLLQLRSIRHHQGFSKLYVPPRRKKTLLQKYRNIKEKYSKAKKALQKANMFLLKFRALLTWENEEVTLRLFFFLASLAMVVLIAPRMFYELVLWVWVFTKKFRSGKFSRKVKAYLADLWGKVPPTPLWEKTYLEKDQ